MSKNLLIIGDTYNGHITYKIRGTSMLYPLSLLGWNVEMVDYRAFNEDQLIIMSRNFNAVYLLKVSSLTLLKKIKTAGNVRVIFDLTDALWMPQFLKDGWGAIDQILSESHAIFCCNKYDREYALKHNKNVFVIHPFANVRRFDELKNQIPKSGNLVIGWIGGISTCYSISNVARPLYMIASLHPEVSFHAVGAHVDLGFMKTTCYAGGYDEDTMIREILKMDIGIFPITKNEEDYVTRGPLKALNYMAASIPAACYNSGECSEIIKDGFSGILAKTEQEWIDKLDLVIRNAEFRKNLGINGYNIVKDRFSKEKAAEVLSNALESVIKI